jgi:hypothetical protein
MSLPNWQKQFDWTKQFDWKKSAQLPEFKPANMKQQMQGFKGKAQGAWGKFAPKMAPMSARKKSK